MQTLTDIPAAERRLDLTGVSTAVLEGGDGPPLVCLHGPGANASHWDCVIRDFTATNRVVAPDLPGLGESKLADGKPTAALVIDWLAELISETCPEAPTVIGNGVGGAIAVRFANERAGECARLVLVDALGLRAFEPAPRFGRALNAFVADPTDATHEELWRYCAHDLPRLQSAHGRGMGAVRGIQPRPRPDAGGHDGARRPDGRLRPAGDPGVGTRAHRRSHQPDLGPPRPGDAGRGRRAGQRPVRLAACT